MKNLNYSQLHINICKKRDNFIFLIIAIIFLSSLSSFNNITQHAQNEFMIFRYILRLTVAINSVPVWPKSFLFGKLVFEIKSV